MSQLERLITRHINACIPKREYSETAVVKKLEKEIAELRKWLTDSPDWDTPLWREKYFSMRHKEDNLEEIKNQIQ